MVPLLLADGHVLVRPQVRDLANRLGLQTSPRSAEYDVAIIGGGLRASQRRSMVPPKGCARSSSSARRPAGRRARRHA